tara:strand:+ start:1310 stop:1507 length:198 start_codon:yes stop_codon:yes gene_type:complete
MNHFASQMTRAAQNLAEDITNDVTFRLVLSYLLMGISYVAAAIALMPVVIWFGAGQLAKRLLDER